MTPPLAAALAWSGWCALHSLLIDSPLARGLRRLLGRRQAAYRLLYNLLSLLSVVVLFGWQRTLPASTVLVLPAWSLPLRLALVAAALYLFIAGCRAHDCRTVLGLAQIETARRGLHPSEPQLSTTGILHHVRHPWYAAGLALLWSFGSYTDVELAVHAVLTVYFIVGSLLEERRLLAQFGDRYRRYQQAVPMLVPRPWRSRPGPLPSDAKRSERR